MPKQRLGDQEVAIVTSGGFPLDLPRDVARDYIDGHLTSSALGLYVFLLWEAVGQDDRTFPPVELLAAQGRSPLNSARFASAHALLVGRGWITEAGGNSTIEEDRGGHDAA